MRVTIITDSTADLIPAVKAKVLTVPLTVHFGDTEYIDGITIDHRTFYEKLIETDVIPSTSQATPAAFAEKYALVDSAVVITLSSALSGTYQSACIAAEDRDNIFVVDSGSAAIGTGILVERAITLAEEGLDAAAIAARLEEEKKNICVVALVDTLEYLKKGGRISASVAFAGTLLNLKPVLAIREGEIHMLGKARGSRQGNNLLVQEIEKAGGVDFSRPLLLGYTGLSDHLLEKYIEDSRHLWEGGTDLLRTTMVGSVIGTHAGPGAVAVAFFRKHP